MRYLHIFNGKVIDFELVAELATQGFSIKEAAKKFQISNDTFTKYLILNDMKHLHAHLKKNGIARKSISMIRVKQMQVGKNGTK